MNDFLDPLSNKIPSSPFHPIRSKQLSKNEIKMTEIKQNTLSFKLVLLGESAVGKSSLVLRFCRSQFFEYQESTIGAAFLTQTVQVGDNTIKFEIWDTAGQERYKSLAPMY